jgi:hypothetical protein
MTAAAEGGMVNGKEQRARVTRGALRFDLFKLVDQEAFVKITGDRPADDSLSFVAVGEQSKNTHERSFQKEVDSGLMHWRAIRGCVCCDIERSAEISLECFDGLRVFLGIAVAAARDGKDPPLVVSVRYVELGIV